MGRKYLFLARLSLAWLSLAWLSLACPFLAACPAEEVGIALPEGGPSAIKEEDLRRDILAMTVGDPSERFEKRLGQMHVDAIEAGEGWLCGRRDGASASKTQEGASPGSTKGKDGTRVLVAPIPKDVDGAVSAAVLISLAKAWDRTVPPSRTTWLCIAETGADLPSGERLSIGPFAAGDLVLGARIYSGAADPDRQVGSVNQTWLARTTLKIWVWLEGGQELRTPVREAGRVKGPVDPVVPAP